MGYSWWLPLGAPSSAGGLPGIGCGLPLEVLMVREDDTGSLGAGGGLFWECGEWFYGTMSGPGCTMVLPGPPEGARCHSQYCECLYKPPHRECRRKNAECRRAGRSHLMRPQCDIKATPMRVASQAVATPKPPQCDPKATLMRPQGSHNAPTRLPQCANKATPLKRIREPSAHPCRRRRLVPSGGGWQDLDQNRYCRLE